MTPYRPPEFGPDILYSDGCFIIVDKSAGLLSVPGRGPEKADCVVSRLQSDVGEVYTVHRLDMATSGVMVFARTKEAQRNLSMQFEKRLCQKTYIAHVWGVPSAGTGTVDLPLIVDWPNRPRQKVDHETGKQSLTEYEVLRETMTGAEVRLTPITGRSHQLRVHLSEIGHPILGDRLYAHDEARRAAPRLHLHAESLSFDHPETGERVSFSCLCPFGQDAVSEIT